MTETEDVPEFYPGSKKTRREAQKPTVEFIPDPWREKFTVKTVRGQQVRLYTVSAIADALGVSVPTIRFWIKSGYIPQAPYRLPSTMIVAGQKAPGRRLYTEEVIDAAVAIFEKHGILGSRRIVWEEHADVPIEIIEAWTRITQSDRVEN